MEKVILKEFIENYVCKNSLIRLWYSINGVYEMVIKDHKSVCMEWEILKCDSICIYKRYLNNKVIGVTDISVIGDYSEAINIVIEKVELQDFRNNLLKSIGI